MEYTVVLHVSPCSNDQSIMREGLNPEYARTARKCLWYLDEGKLAWGLAHVSLRHKLPVSALTVWVAYLPKPMLIKTRWVGVYQHDKIISPDKLGQWDRSQVDAFLAEVRT